MKPLVSADVDYDPVTRHIALSAVRTKDLAKLFLSSAVPIFQKMNSFPIFVPPSTFDAGLDKARTTSTRREGYHSRKGKITSQ